MLKRNYQLLLEIKQPEREFNLLSEKATFSNFALTPGAKPALVLLLLILLSPFISNAQQYKVKYYTQENGLQNELVKSVTLDSIGFIWGGTDFGLVRYNGKEFLDYPDLLSSNYIKSVFCTRNGRIFVNSDLGFDEVIYDKNTVKAKNILRGGTQLSDSLLWYPKQFFEDDRENLWFSDNAAVYRYFNNELHRYYLGPENTTGSYVHSFSFSEDGYNHLILISNTGNFYKYQYDTDLISPITGVSGIRNVTGAICIKKGRILLGFNDVLGEIFFDENAGYLSHHIVDKYVDASSFYLKPDSSAFIGSWTKGLWEYELSGSQGTLKKVNEINSQGAINQIIMHKDEYILASDNGIIILQNEMFTAPYEGLSKKYIQDIAYDSINKKILFTDGDQIISVDEETLKADNVFTSPGYLILQILPLNRKLWFSDNMGFLRQLENGQITKTIDLSQYGGSIYNLISDIDRNLWLCQDNLMGVIRVNPDYQIKVFGENYGLTSQVNFIKQTPYTHLMLGTNYSDKYLLYYDRTKDSIINMSPKIDINKEMGFSVNDITFDDNMVMWMATNQGMFMVKGNDASKVSLELQTSGDIKAVTTDKQGNIWFASSTGVSKYDKKNTIPFDHLDGLPSKTIAFRSLITDTKNRIWAGTLSGIAFTKNDQSPQKTSRPIFLDISEKGIPISKTADNNFNNLTYLSFNFISTEYPTDAIYYLVKMENKDADWKLLFGKNEIFYTDLEKGKYKLYVKARQHGNYQWSEPLVYSFNIHTVWYQSWLSWTVFGVFFIVVLYQLTKWRNRRLEIERVKLNTQVRERTLELETTTKEIEAKNKQLIIAKEEAERSSRVKADFLSTMSHEIRTPLNGVLGMINLILLENPSGELLDKINTMKFSAENLLALINDILDFNKIDEGKLKLENIKFNLPEIIQNIRTGFLHATRSKNIKLSLDIDKNTPEFVLGDPTRLTQIITNLLGNAIKFTDAGEVKIAVNSRDLKDNKSEIYFSITDTGIGISPDQIQSIFETFSQASSDTTRKYGGSGLGLAITKKLLEIMDSRIQVKSKIGVGSEFAFKLIFEKVAAEPKAFEKEAADDLNQKSLKGMKILLVEDNLINTRIAKQILEKWEIEVEVAGDGQIAIDKFEPGKFDLILMDLHMPNVDGFEATRAIRKIDTKIPIVALTAAVKIQDKDKVLEAGMNEFVSKPFKPKELFSLIKTLTSSTDSTDGSPETVRPEYESLKGYRVLLVEDNDINIKIATQFLHKWDLEVDLAKDGQLAIDMFEPDKYHVILMDLHLPKVDGYGATKAIREIDKKIPIIALTAAAMVQEKERVLAEGMNDFISKPFKPRDLYNKILNNILNATLNEG